MYTALVLDENSRHKLLQHFQGLIPPSWEIIAHHMTINMGDAASGPLANSKFQVGQPAGLTVINYSYDEKVMAAGVQCDVPSSNAVKHITLAVNRPAGGKPILSNKLTNWQSISPLQLQGIIQEVQ